MLALLIYLVVEGGHHHREKLIDIFWSASGHKQGSATLRSTLARLKKTLSVAGEFLITESGKIGFDFEQHYVLDIKQLRDATQSGTLEQLEMALTLLHGEFIEGFAVKDAPEFDEWMTLQREIWHQLAEQAFEQASRILVEQGNILSTIETATRWVAHSPLNDFAHQRLIETYALSGNRSLALQAYERCKAILSDELSILPSVHLTRLIERIRSDMVRHPPNLLSQSSQVQIPKSIVLPFVGRAQEYQQLIDAYRQNTHGQPQVVILSGDAGVGKTRLSEAFLNWVTVSQTEVDILKGQAFEIGGRLPYQPIVEALRPRIEAENAPEDLLADVWLAELAQLLPELLDRYPDLPAPFASDVDLTRFRIFEAVTRLGESLADRRKLILFIDDVQWADDASLDLLHYLTRRWHEQNIPIFVLLTIRQENINTDTRLQEWLNRLDRDSALSRLSLDHLSPTSLTLLVSQLASKPVPDESIHRFSQWLYDETQGQPFFMSEMLQMLAQRNLIIYQSDTKVPRIDISATLKLIDAEGQLPLPSTIRDLILVRLERLGEASFAILLAGSVFGRETSFDTLKQVSGLSEEATLINLEKMLKQGFLVETETNHLPYRFSHDKIREVVYAQASEARRQIYHRRALESLIQIDAPSAELAFHAFLANQITLAFGYSLTAGQNSLKTYALSDALMHFEQAHAIYEQADCDLNELLQLYQQWGRALELAHHFDEALAVYEELASIGKTFDNQMMTLVSLISQAILFATTTPLKNPVMGKILAREALELARKLGEHEIEARALWSMLLVQHYGSGGDEKAKEYGELALSIAREFDLEEMIAYILNDLNWVYCALGDLRQAQVCIQEALTYWRKLNNTSMLLDSLNGAGILYSLVGEFEQSETTVHEGIVLAHSVGNIWNQISLKANLLWVYRERGQYDRIVHALETAIDFSEKQMPNIAPYYQTSLALIYADLGLTDPSRDLCDHILERVNSTPEFWRLSNMIDAIHAYLHIQQGNLPSAELALQHIQLAVDDVGIAHVTVIAPLLRCQLALAQSDYEGVVQQSSQFINVLQTSGVRVGLADAYFYKAQGLFAQEKLEHSRQALIYAHQIAESLQARRILWQILLRQSDIEARLGNNSESIHLRQEAKAILDHIVKTIPEGDMRASFIKLPEIRQIY